VIPLRARGQSAEEGVYTGFNSGREIWELTNWDKQREDIAHPLRIGRGRGGKGYKRSRLPTARNRYTQGASLEKESLPVAILVGGEARGGRVS